MFVYIARLMVVIAGPVIGYVQVSQDSRGILIGTAVAVGVIGAEILIQRVHLDDMVAGLIGIILGLVAASLISYVVPALMDSPDISGLFDTYRLLLSIVLAYIGMIIALTKKGELDLLDREVKLTGQKLSRGVKVVDSSAIIDARILDIIEVGFIEGVLVVPTFIMNEVQALADSSDDEKRRKGRRSLDILKSMMESEKTVVKVYEKDYPDIKEADAKLLKICREVRAKLISCDFNLSKAAEARGIEVLNVNYLANALKPKLLPGEAVDLFILKKGKDSDQGIGFLDDGTMVVVDGGKKHIGKNAEVTVTSVLQKPSGKMIFARID